MHYLNDSGYEIPNNTILIFGTSYEDNGYADEIIEPLMGKIKRDSFQPTFYHCLPLIVANQYGFGIKSMHSFTAEYSGGQDPIKFEFIKDEDSHKQKITNHFNNGIITVQHDFLLRTPPGINLMTVQAPNQFIEGLHAMSGVVESDNLRMSFTFNLKLTPNVKISVNKGDMLAAFLPIERYSVEKYKLVNFSDLYNKDIYDNESYDLQKFAKEREELGKYEGNNQFGKRYFNGKNMNNEKYKDHQKGIIK